MAESEKELKSLLKVKEESEKVGLKCNIMIASFFRVLNSSIGMPGEISITSDMQMTLPLWQKVKRN